MCERASWREIAYSGFIWWASAGEKRREHPDADPEASEEESEDEDGKQPGRVGAIPYSPGAEPERVPLNRRPRRRSSDDGSSLEMEVVGYFHRMTGRLLGVMAEIVEEGEEDEDVFFSLEDLERLGLDRYSEGDRRFVKAVCRRYFGREASMEEGGWSCCTGGRWC